MLTSQQSLNWILRAPNNNNYYALNSLNLGDPYFDSNPEGVYVIWYFNSQSYAVAVYAGSGKIKGRITAHRTDNRIQSYASNTLYVTWALVVGNQRGVEQHLHDKLEPLVGESPGVLPVSVNLPNLPWD